MDSASNHGIASYVNTPTRSALIHATTVDEAIDPKNAMPGKIGTAISDLIIANTAPQPSLFGSGCSNKKPQR